MNHNTKIGISARKRDDKGVYLPSDYGNKQLRSMRLSDEAWQLLEEKGIEQGKTRTDIVEELVRGANEQAIVMKAIEAFIKLRTEEFGENVAQRGKEFSTKTRDWSAFNKFMELVKNSPWELGIGEEIQGE
ncbi:hypothetical protein [Tolypothrix sp. PCC 7601]|uniref:hypothetical protein n=1 Tax=Tolypothrix sp. PCC 7601 TaxID=1188 RepID=UPI0021DFB4D0|nr:hypothetical protein [Tolypothrix sp. PCC 7601]UYD38965.1 hypothetical protein HG267_41495 [Tolypothrix sp. PCC 7601]